MLQPIYLLRRKMSGFHSRSGRHENEKNLSPSSIHTVAVLTELRHISCYGCTHIRGVRNLVFRFCVRTDFYFIVYNKINNK
jgi:hypothetical protein